MSLTVRDPRSRGRSKSPGGRDRDTSRDRRGPSPQPKSKKSSKKYDDDFDSSSDGRSRRKSTSKKYYDDDSESEHRSKKKASKKRDSSDSDSDERSRRKSSKKYRDETSSESDRKGHKKGHKKRQSSGSESDDRSRRKAAPKVHNKSRRDDSSDDSSSSDSEDDRRRSKHQSSSRPHDKHNKHDKDDKHRRGSPTDHKSVIEVGGKRYVQAAKPVFERERRESKHESYAEYDRHEHGRPQDYSRQLSYASQNGHGLPGQFPGAAPHSGQYHYAQPEHKVAYAPKAEEIRPGYSMSAHPQYARPESQHSALHAPDTSGLRRLSISGGAAGGLGAGLMTAGHGHGHVEGGLPPGSPLLEAYRGTYQSISPMPSPLMLAAKPHHHHDDLSDLSDLSPLSGKDSLSSDSDSDSDSLAKIKSSKSKKLALSSAKKKVSFYNPEKDALALAAALRHTKPESSALIKVLPPLSHDNILELRTEYKKHVKVGGKGINIAKHIKMKVPGNVGKIAHAVALGQWESEAHWANFWYQSNTSRRELLIESLMGRSNSEIVKIKDAFSDKRYNDSLTKCMETELKKDKFRNAVLLALEEKRMSEKEKLSLDLVQRDVQDLYRALVAKDGGETAMINIIVVRSDHHLREVMRLFEASYKRNFAREMIKKSQNLVVSFPLPTSSSCSHPPSAYILPWQYISYPPPSSPFPTLFSPPNSPLTNPSPPPPSIIQGETLAHILNGALNRPVRDALLLRQALTETAKDRTELLVSRLVRFHWEPRHFERVKVEYKRKYGKSLERDIEEGTKGDFGEFCVRVVEGEGG